MSKLLIFGVVMALIGAYVGIQKVIENWGWSAIALGAFCIITLYGISKLYSYGVEHPNG